MKNEGFKIALVEKNGFHQRSYMNYIQKNYKDVDIFTTANLEEAVALAEAGSINLMLVEYFQEDGTVMSLLRDLGPETLAEIPVIVVTNPGNAQMAREVVEAGAVAYIERGADLGMLGKLMSEILYRLRTQSTFEETVLSTIPPVEDVVRTSFKGRDRLIEIVGRSASEPQKKISVGDWGALLIGVAKYKDYRIGNLEAPVNDVNVVRRILVDRYGFESDLVTSLIGENAGWGAIEKALNLYQQKGRENDSLLIFFAGHGVWEDGSTDEGHWLPYDAAEGEPRSWYPNYRLRSMVARMPMRHVLVIADCCFSGSLLDQNRSLRAERIMDDGNLRDYYIHGSRWALTSHRKQEVKDRGYGTNSPFVEALDEVMTGRDFLTPEILCAKLRENEQLHRLGQYPICGRLRRTGENLGSFLFLPKV